MEQLSFAAACKKSFGVKPNQTLQQFAIEIKGLYQADPEFWKSEFQKVGIELMATPVMPA